MLRSSIFSYTVFALFESKVEDSTLFSMRVDILEFNLLNNFSIESNSETLGDSFFKVFLRIIYSFLVFICLFKTALIKSLFALGAEIS